LSKSLFLLCRTFIGHINKRVKKAFPDSLVVISSYGAFGGVELLDHTMELVGNYRPANSRSEQVCTNEQKNGI